MRTWAASRRCKLPLLELVQHGVPGGELTVVHACAGRGQAGCHGFHEEVQQGSRGDVSTANAIVSHRGYGLVCARPVCTAVWCGVAVWHFCEVHAWTCECSCAVPAKDSCARS